MEGELAEGGGICMLFFWGKTKGSAQYFLLLLHKRLDGSSPSQRIPEIYSRWLNCQKLLCLEPEGDNLIVLLGLCN
jgi:hypothetical protein